MLVSDCDGCGGALGGDGYFFAATPRHVRQLAISRTSIHQVELGFDVPGESRRELEQRLQRLHAECGCHAAAIAFLLAVAAIALGVVPLPDLPKIPLVLTLVIGPAVLAKFGVMAAARLRIVFIADRLARNLHPPASADGETASPVARR
jgi:hypothetical protein